MSEHPTCAISGKALAHGEAVYVSTLRTPVLAMLKQDHPEVPDNAAIDRTAADAYRARYVAQLLEQERGTLTDLDKTVLESFARRETVTENVDAKALEQRTIGERAADRIAIFGGSWTFIITFLGALGIWMAINSRSAEVFDPYPFILLNLVLSCVAALQAPVIMMSQRRQEEKDRARAENDYRINLKAELEIRTLHDKLDHLVNRQWQRLAEIQSLQLELLQDLAARKKP
jgi:uncharacterized membrane protein